MHLIGAGKILPWVSCRYNILNFVYSYLQKSDKSTEAYTVILVRPKTGESAHLLILGKFSQIGKTSPEIFWGEI
jgi:hypothetical protein